MSLSDLSIIRALSPGQLIVIGSKNFGWSAHPFLRLPVNARNGVMATVSADVLQQNADLARLLPKAIFIDLLAQVSATPGQVPAFTGDGRLISFDTRHLSIAGAKFVGQRLFAHPLLQPLH